MTRAFIEIPICCGSRDKKWSKSIILIDNFIVQIKSRKFLIITSLISDYFLYFICRDIMRPKYDPVPKFIQIHLRNTNSLEKN